MPFPRCKTKMRSASANLLLRELSYRPFLVLLMVGLAIRVIVMVSYFPAIMLAFDSARYARVDGQPMFSDYWMPAGYPFLLRLLRVVSRELWITIAVQHLIGLSVGVILFLTMRHLKVSRSVACLPASVALLSGDHIYSEHIILADFLLTFLAAAGLSVAVFALAGGVRLRTLATASAILGTAALAKSVGLVLIPILALCTLCFATGKISDRMRTLVVALLPAVAVLAAYAAGCKLVKGKYLGLSDMRGWNVYSRVAPFADCRRFSPPDGTAILCEQTVPAERPGPFYYVWNTDSVARRHFPLGPKTGRQLGAFATQAILHQPFDYVRTVVIDLWRYVEPATGRHWSYAGQTDNTVTFGWRDPAVEQLVVPAMSRGYRGTELRIYGQSLLNAYQQLFRLGGLILAALMILSIYGICRGRGPLHIAVVLFGLGAFGLYILPVATLSYDFRYGLPPAPLMAVSGILGALCLWGDRLGRGGIPQDPKVG